MKIHKAVCLLMAAGAVTSARGDGLEDTMRAWCSQSGTWQGIIDITDAEGQTQTVSLVSRHRCTPDGRLHVVEEDFLLPGAPSHTLKVTYADPTFSGFRTAYFASGKESAYVFRFDSVEVKDNEHWKQSITSTSEGDVYEGRKAILRYTRTRDGDRIVSRKEVRFLDTDTGGDFETRSLIVQELVQP
jgi:hypothetical protein